MKTEDIEVKIIDELLDLFRRVESLAKYLGDDRYLEERKAPIKPIKWVLNLIELINIRLEFVNQQIHKLK